MKCRSFHFAPGLPRQISGQQTRLLPAVVRQAAPVRPEKFRRLDLLEKSRLTIDTPNYKGVSVAHLGRMHAVGRTHVLLHGYPGSMADFVYLAPLLAQHGQVFVIEYPGFGYSARQHNSHFDTLSGARCTAEVIERFGLNEPERELVVWPHSLGAEVFSELLVYYALNSDRLAPRIRQVNFLTPAAPLVEPLTIGKDIALTRLAGLFLHQGPFGLLDYAVRLVAAAGARSPLGMSRYYRQILGRNTPREIVSEWLEGNDRVWLSEGRWFLNWQRTEGFVEALRYAHGMFSSGAKWYDRAVRELSPQHNIPKVFPQHLLEEAFARLRVPVTVLLAEDDRLILPAYQARFADRLGQLKVDVKLRAFNTGHMLPVEAPQAICDVGLPRAMR